MPEIKAIRRENGVAGQTAFATTVQYPDEPESTVRFVGSVAYGGPVVMIMPSGAQTFVTDAERHGPFGEQWVRRFFAEHV